MWFMVSMGRPDQCRDVIESMIACGVTVPGKLIVNGNQQEAAYRAIILPKGWDIEVLPHNIGMLGVLAKSFREYPSEEYYGVLADDEYACSEGFDTRIVKAAGRFSIAHGNDQWRTDEGWIHTFATYGGDLVRAVGWWPLPGLWHNGFDNVWQVIAAEFGLRRYCRDVLTRHPNPDGGTAEWDETYSVGRSRATQDMARFEQWKRDEWPILRHRLRKVLK